MLFSSMSGLKFVTTFASCSNPFCIRHSGYMSQVRFLPSLNLDSDFFDIFLEFFQDFQILRL